MCTLAGLSTLHEFHKKAEFERYNYRVLERSIISFARVRCVGLMARTIAKLSARGLFLCDPRRKFFQKFLASVWNE
jgi:hypothetical protein